MKSLLNARATCLAVLFGLMTALPATGQAAVMFYTDIIAFEAASTTALVEDFEAFVPKNTALSDFMSNGNKYTGLAGSPFPNVFVAAAGFTNFGVPMTMSAVLTANGDEDFTVDFGSPPTALGFDTYLNGLGPATVSVFGAGGLLDTFALGHDATMVGFLGMTSSEPITSIRWTTTLGGRINTGIDNIRQGRATDVPEPLSILLLGLGLAGLGALRHRRH